MVCFRYYQIYFHIYFFLFDNQRDKIFNNYLFGITKNSSTTQPYEFKVCGDLLIIKWRKG